MHEKTGYQVFNWLLRGSKTTHQATRLKSSHRLADFISVGKKKSKGF